MKPATRSVLRLVADERLRQELIGVEKQARGEAWSTCADPKMAGGDDRRFVVLAEEFGEVAKAMLDQEPDANLITELVQVAAVSVAWVEAIQAGRVA